MKRLALVGLLLALPFAALPLVGRAVSGGGGDGSLAPLRTVRPAAKRPAATVDAVAATPRRVSFLVARPAGVEVSIRDSRGRLVRRLGHFTVPARQRLVLSWDGRRLPAGAYVAVVRARGSTARASFRLRGWPGADDADRQSLREPRHA